MAHTIVTWTIASLVSAAVCMGTDWNQWRGPDRGGVVADSPPLAESWDKGGPPKVWLSEKLLGGGEEGLGSVSVADGKVYLLLYSKAPPPKEVIVCLDAQQGKTLWKQEYPGPAGGQGPNSTPCIIDGRCYICGDKTLYCVDAKNGNEIWKAPLLRQEVASSPLVVDNVVVVLGGQLLGFDAKTGRQVWAAVLEGFCPSPVPWTSNGKKYVLCNTSQGLACVDPADGKILWKAPAGGNGTGVVSGDIAVVLAMANQPGLVAYRLTREKAEQIWSVPIVDRGSTPVIYKDCVYVVGANRAACYGLDKGDLKWEQQFPCEITSPAIADGKVFGLVENSNNLLMLRASPAKYELLGKFVAGANFGPSPAICDGRLYLRVGTGVACYDLRNR